MGAWGSKYQITQKRIDQMTSSRLEEKRAEGEQTRRAAEIALDFVDFGEKEISAERVSKQLPAGITARMLYSDVVRIAWPSLIELTLTQLTSMVDLMMVGGLGPWAIASVGLTTQPKFLLMTMFIAMNVGATALVARYRGAGEPERANEILRQALLLSFILSAAASVFGFFFSEQLVHFMGAADAETLRGGTVYLQIQFLGFIPMALTSTLTATLRGVGHTRIAMIYNLVSNLVNVILNYVLIHGHFGFPRLELAGASLATIIGQAIAFVLALAVVLKGDHYLHLQLKKGFRPLWHHLRSILDIGLPAMAEQLIMRTGNIMFVKTVASLGTLAYATHQVAMNIQAMTFMSGQAFAVSATSLVGQSLGKRRPDMAESYASHTRRLGMLISLSLSVTFFFFGRQIVGLYSDDVRIITQGARILKLMALIVPFQSSQFILTGALRGAGDTRATAVIIFLTVLLVRPGFAFLSITQLGLGLDGAWLAVAVDQVIRSFLVLLRYNSGKWKRLRIE